MHRTHKVMRKAGPSAAVDQFSAVSVRTSELHAGGAHAREREPHALVDAVHWLQKCAEVSPRCSDHRVIAGKGEFMKVLLKHFSVRF